MLRATLTSPVYCLDISDQPSDDFVQAQQRIKDANTGSIHYRQLDVRSHEASEAVVEAIANERGALHGLVAAAGVNSVIPALKMTPEEGKRVSRTHYLFEVLADP